MKNKYFEKNKVLEEGSLAEVQWEEVSDPTCSFV